MNREIVNFSLWTSVLNLHETADRIVIGIINLTLNLKVVIKLTNKNDNVTKMSIKPRHARHCTEINQSFELKKIYKFHV